MRPPSRHFTTQRSRAMGLEIIAGVAVGVVLTAWVLFKILKRAR